MGVDIAAPKGSPVIAPAGGVVTLVHEDMFYSGGTLLIDHGMGLSSAFIHLSKVLVKSGQRVAQGERIAEIGATGRATGPHLDWRLNWYQERLDPQWFMGGTSATHVEAGTPMKAVTQ
jgi:murein DD-endopeptidase MepM/ murein hydrolase activator NlpD